MKTSKKLFNAFYTTASSKIICIPKAIKKPKIDYIEPKKWNLPFEKPSQVRPKAFVDLSTSLFRPAKNICKIKCTYKNPEFIYYHTYSYYDMEFDLFFKRCRRQPSSLTKIIEEESNEKAP